MMVKKHSSGEGSDFLYWLLTLQCGNWEWFQKLGPCSLQEHQDANVLKRHLECLSQPQWAGCPVKWIEEWPIKPESVSLQQNQVTAINYNPTTLKFFFFIKSNTQARSKQIEIPQDSSWPETKGGICLQYLQYLNSNNKLWISNLALHLTWEEAERSDNPIVLEKQLDFMYST